jgi:hypothetical protein
VTSRTGEAFDATRAAGEVTDLLAAAVPADGPTSAEGDPATGEWTVTTGAGFRIVPLWESEPLTGLYDPEWSAAVDVATGHLAAVRELLEPAWGPSRTIGLDGPLVRWQQDRPVEPLFEALFDEDLYGDLQVWGPIGPTGRWVAVTVGHSDGDAPLVLAALVADQPINQPAEVDL